MIFYKKTNSNAIPPTKGSKYAAGYDLYACISEPEIIMPHSSVMIGTGIVVEPPVGHFGGVFARSGLATKMGIRPANCVGVIDEDYRGEIKVSLHNDSDAPYTVNPNDRVAQIVFIPYLDNDLVEDNDLTETDRGDSGFGSTGQ